MRRGRGRPKITWGEVIRKDLIARDLNDSLALDRAEWRREIRVAEPG